MIIKIVVKLLGGIWAVRQKCKLVRVKIVKRIYLFVYTSYLQNNGSWISLDANLEDNICFPHGIFGIFISGHSNLGKNCVMFHQVTIGSNTLIDSGGIGSPQIGDNCYIGAGAKIIGKVKVGNNVRIGANAVVVKDVPDNCVVTSGNHQQNIKKEKMNNRFYHQYHKKWVYFDNGRHFEVTDKTQLDLLNSSFSNDGKDSKVD